MFLRSKFYYGRRLFSVILLAILFVALLATVTLTLSNAAISDSGIVSVDRNHDYPETQTEPIMTHPIIPANMSIRDGCIIAIKVFAAGSTLCALVLAIVLKMRDYYFAYNRRKRLMSRQNRQLLLESLRIELKEDSEKGPTKAPLELQ